MEFEDFGARFSVAVEDFSGSWSLLQETLQGRGPLRHVTLRNKFGNPVPITELPIQFLLSTDSKLQNIKPFQGSPVTWFRNPYARLILVSGEDADDYKRTLRAQLKALIEREKDPLGPTEWVVCYIKPAASDPLSKGPRKVFDALRHDFNTRRRERCVRLDFPVQQGQGSIAGLEDLEQLLKAAVKSSFETRAAAYEEEVRKLMARRLEPGWNFSTLYLIKDSLAIMLEAAGLLEDAFREYFELEACYLEALKQGGNLAGRHFGGKTDGDDAAQILKAAWRETRSSVMRGNGVAEFYFRQYLFACQARLLFKLNRPTEVAERGLQFVHNFVQLLVEQQAAAVLPQLFREAWAFSACISLATTTSRLMGVAAVLNKQAPSQPDSPAAPPQTHRRSVSLREEDGAEAQRHVSRSLSAGDLAQDQSNRESADGAAQHRSTVDASELQQAPALKPLKINKNNFAGLEAQGMIAQLRVPNQDKQSGDVQGAATPHMKMEVNWDLGVSGHSDEMTEEDEDTSLWSRTPSAVRKPPIPHQAYYCLLGHLYAAARLELMRMGHTLNLSQHTPAGPAHGNGASPTASRLSSQHASHGSTPAHTFTGMPVAPTPSMLPKVQYQDQQQQQQPPSQQNGVQMVQEAAPAASTDLGTASSLNAAVSAASSRRPVLQSTSSKKLSRFAVESQRLPPTEGLPPLAPATPLATPMATRGDSVTSQVNAAPGASPARTTTDEGDETSSNDGSMHRSEVDYSTLARAEAAAQQQDPTSSQVGGGDPPPGVLQRSRPLPSSSDAGHLALAAQQAGDGEGDGDGSSQGDWSVASTQHDSKDSALEDVAGAGSGKGLEIAGSAVPTWLSDWRLKLALGSWQLYQELWMELSGAAAACYTKCGRKRNGTLMQADIADALIARGNTARAAMVLQRQARLFMREGWWDLAAAVLQRLLHCQKLLMQAVLPATCLQLLGLPQHVRRKLDADAIQADLLQIAAQPSFTHPASPLFAPQQNPVAKCHAGSAMYLRPVDGCCSLFSGQTGPDGQPLLNPNQCPPGHAPPEPMQGAERPLNQTLPDHQPSGQSQVTPQQKGALDICVGDAVSLTVQLHCALPQAVDLKGVVLILALLQEVTVAYSPKSATSSKADFSRITSSLKQRLTDSPHAPGSPTSHSGNPAAAADDADVTTQWQETEELACSLCASAVQSPESPGVSGNHSASHTSLPGDTLTLQPGLNMVTFRVLPLKRGLYTLKHMQGSLGSLSLHIPVMLKEPNALALHSQAAAERPSNAPIAAPDTHNPQAAALGSVLNTGDLHQETVVLNVHSCRQRLAVSAAALKGALVAGQPQWLAVVIMPLHDALHEACIHMGMASRAATGLGESAGSSSLGASLGSSGRSPRAGHEDASNPSHSPHLDVLHADRAILAPLQVPSHSQTDSVPALPRAQPAGDEASRAPASLQRQQAQTPFPEEAALAGSAHAEASGELELLRRDAGAEASVSGSSWVSMEGSQGPNLPAWAATRPSLLWVWVRPGLLPLQHETVRVTPSSMRGFGRVMGGDEVGAFASPRAACPQPSGAVNVQVNVEYFQGCQRAHAAWLTIPITPAFRIHTTARELPMKRVAIQVTIASNLPWPVTLTALTLAPQHGFRLDPSMGLATPLCPLTLHPSTTASALLFVSAKSGGRSASRGHMLRGGAGQVCTLDIQYKVESQAAPSSPVSEVVSEYSRRLLDDATVPQPPSGPPVQQAVAEGEEVSVQHIFSLVMAPVEGTPRSTVYIRLLGPFSARVGEAVTLCWQLERSPGAASGHDSNTVQYDVTAMAEGWRPSGVRAGCIGLSAEGGTATIEASWVPIMAGTLPAPELHLRDLSHQEAFDVGANTEFINVLPL